ncbi:hypothetical protein GGI13_007401, partial [Coemansia sp. RSA 455]
MFNRLATRTARTVGVSHRVAHRLIAPYSSDSIPPPAPPSGAPGNSPNKDKKEAPLSSLLDMLSTQRPGTPVTKMPKFSQMLNSDKPVKGDFSGFIGSGMYGGRLAKEEAEDPM